MWCICYFLQTDGNSSISYICLHSIDLCRRDEIIQLLQSGVTIICDRYVYSGICYSISKGSDKTWAFATEVGLPKPDLTIFMDLSPEKAASRADYGAERYEKLDFQKLVYEEFIHFCNSDSNLKVF